MVFIINSSEYHFFYKTSENSKENGNHNILEPRMASSHMLFSPRKILKPINIPHRVLNPKVEEAKTRELLNICRLIIYQLSSCFLWSNYRLKTAHLEHLIPDSWPQPEWLSFQFQGAQTQDEERASMIRLRCAGQPHVAAGCFPADRWTSWMWQRICKDHSLVFRV